MPLKLILLFSVVQIIASSVHAESSDPTQHQHATDFFSTRGKKSLDFDLSDDLDDDRISLERRGGGNIMRFTRPNANNILFSARPGRSVMSKPNNYFLVAQKLAARQRAAAAAAAARKRNYFSRPNSLIVSPKTGKRASDENNFDLDNFFNAGRGKRNVAGSEQQQQQQGHEEEQEFLEEVLPEVLRRLSGRDYFVKRGEDEEDGSFWAVRG